MCAEGRGIILRIASSLLVWHNYLQPSLPSWFFHNDDVYARCRQTWQYHEHITSAVFLFLVGLVFCFLFFCFVFGFCFCFFFVVFFEGGGWGGGAERGVPAIAFLVWAGTMMSFTFRIAARKASCGVLRARGLLCQKRI